MELSTGRRVTVFPARVDPATVEFVNADRRQDGPRHLDGSATQWVGDLDETGQELPDEHRRTSLPAWLRSHYETVVSGSYVNYYALPDGPPVADGPVYAKPRSSGTSPRATRSVASCAHERKRPKGCRSRPGQRTVTVPFPPQGRRRWRIRNN